MKLAKRLMLRTVGGGGAWTPANVTTTIWFDATDADTITLNGSNVSQWRDKSGNARHANQGTPTAQPALSAGGLNGKDIVVFDGSSDSLVHGFVQVSQNCALFVVASASSQSGYRGIFCTKNSAQPSIAMFSRGGSNSWGTWYSPTNTYYGASDIQGAGWQILEMLRPSTGGTFMLNGAADGTFAGAEGQAAGSIGGEIVSHQLGAVSIAEIVLLPANPDAATREKIEGYLAHKWGLSASLPSGHPYKSTPP